MDIRLAALLVCGGVIIGASSRPAAMQQPPEPDGNTADLIREMERQRSSVPATTPAPAPAAPAAPAATPAAPSSQPPASAPIDNAADTTLLSSRLLREGTLINQRRGRMSRIASNASGSASVDWVFTFDSDGRGRGEPPMVLLPCTNLMQMERVVERSGESVSFTVTGQVFVYKGRNYLLPSLYLVNRRSELNSGR
jgi:hypothetical protein